MTNNKMLVALEPHYYRHDLDTGELYEAETEEHAYALVRMKRSRYATDADIPARQRREYNRRDMKATD